MAKKLLGYSRPDIKPGMSETKKVIEMKRWKKELQRMIVSKTDGAFGKLDELEDKQDG